jgi:hypothetical protein
MSQVERLIDELADIGEVSMHRLDPERWWVSVKPTHHAPLWWYDVKATLESALAGCRAKAVELHFLAA